MRNFTTATIIFATLGLGTLATSAQEGTSTPRYEGIQATGFICNPIATTPAAAQKSASGIIVMPGAYDEVTEVEGRSEYYIIKGEGFRLSPFGLQAGNQVGAAEVVYHDSGVVYFRTPLGVTTYSSYVVGELSDDGTTITVQYPQPIDTVEGQTSSYESVLMSVTAQVMDRVEVDNGDGTVSYTYVPNTDPEVNKIVYTINEDGSISMPSFQDGLEYKDGKVVAPERILSCYMMVPEELSESGEEEAAWQGDAVVTLSFQPLPEDLVTVEVPDNLDWEIGWIVEDSNYRYLIEVAFDGDDVYISGLCSLPGRDTIKGTISGNEASFPTRQYLGIFADYYTNFMYFLNAEVKYVNKISYLTPVDGPFVMNFDPETRIFSAKDETSGCLFNADLEDGAYYYLKLCAPTFRQQSEDEWKAAPKDPVFRDWHNHISDHNLIYVDVKIPNTNVNGAVLLEDRLSYSVYVDDEPYGFDMDLFDVPYDTNNQVIFNQGQTKSLYFNNMPDMVKVSVQSHYLAPDGETYSSNLVSYYDPASSVKSMEETSEVVGVQYFDITGRLVAEPQKGSFVIKVSTLANGTCKVEKVVL